MTKQAAGAKPTSTFDIVLEIGWLLVAMTTPLWVYFGSQRPFDPQKLFLIRSLIWLLATLIAARYLIKPQSILLRHKRWLVPAAILAGLWLVTTITAVHPQQSWWGSYERGQGSLTQLTYLLLFAIVATQLRTKAQAWRLLAAFVLTAFPLLLLGFAQALGWQPLPLVTDARSPLYATLGRANFLAAYLVILLPLTAALGLQRHRRWQHTILAILLLAELTVIGLTMARTAWLAAAVSLGLFALLWWGGSWRWQYGVGLGLTAVSGPLLILTNINQQGSLAARRTIWQATMKLIGERPFLGYGLDSLELIFPGVYPPELVYYQGRDVFVDRAHNLLLDWAVTTGIIGVVVHLLFWGVIFWLMGRAWQQTADRQRRLLLTAILAALIGNLTNTLTSFDVTTTSVAVWLLLGVGMALSQPALPSVHLPTPSGIRWGLAGLVIVGGLSAVWWGNGRPFLADQAAYQAKHQAQAGDLDSAISTAERAIRLAPYEPNYYEALARLYWQKISDDPTAWAQAEAALLAARDLRPMADGRWLTLAEFYAVSAVELNRETATFATQAYAQAAQLSPHDSQIYTAWGQFEWVRREWETAVSLWQQAADLDATNAPAHAYLAQGYWRLGEPEQAADALAQALKYDPHNKLALALQQQISARP